MLLPPLPDVLYVQVRLQNIWQAVPDPVLASLPVQRIQMPAINVEALVPCAMSATLNLIHGPRAGHANVDDEIDLATGIRLLPKGRHQVPHRLVADSDGLGMHQDSDGRRVDGISRAGVLCSPRREVLWEGFGDFPRRVDGIFSPERLGAAAPSASSGTWNEEKSLRLHKPESQ